MTMLKFRAPALPIPGVEYKQEYFTQLIRSLALYFNQIDSQTPVQWESVTAGDFIGGLFTGDGTGIKFPYLQLSHYADQNLAATSTPTMVSFPSVDNYNGFININEGRAVALYDGVYNYQYSLQLSNTANALHYAWVWIRKNGVDYAGSATKFTVPARKNPTDHGYLAAVSNIVLPLAAGDYVELFMAADAIEDGVTDGIYLEFYAADSDGFTHPSIPSAIAFVEFLSVLPTSTVTGLSGLGFVGSVSVTGDSSVSITGTVTTGSVGSVTVTTSP